MRSLRWALIQYDGHLDTERDTRDVHVEERLHEDIMRRWPLHAKGEASGDIKPADH